MEGRVSVVGVGAQVEIVVNEPACIRCGACVQTCPTDVLRSDAQGLPVVAYLDECQACFLCVIDCPREAINVQFRGIPTSYRLHY